MRDDRTMKTRRLATVSSIESIEFIEHAVRKKLRIRFRMRLAISVLAIASLALPAPAQTRRGAVTGRVLDPSGAVVAGAQVSLTGVETGFRLSTKSNATGVYRFDSVDPGVYDIEVTAAGFRTYLGKRINVEAN